MTDFARLSEDFADCLGALDRPRRVPVSVGAAEALYLSDAGGYSGPWTSEPVPYLVQPMDSLASRHYEAVCFVGPARTGKTAGLILGWLAHALTNDIGRMMIMHMTEKKAALLSKLDVEPAIEASPKLRALKSPRAHDDAIHLKIFKHGMAVRFAHPSPSELAATTYRYVALTDYDRFTRNIGMGGEIFDTAHKRTETLMSRRMTLVESSPERQLTDPNWQPATPHEAPPTSGILGIYNRGDRHRWYWPCPECGEYFEAKPGLALFATLPSFDDLVGMIRKADISAMAEEHAFIWCPHCGSRIGGEHKSALNAAGVWLRDGELIDRDGRITGSASQSTIASFWMGGVSAAYQTWRGIVLKYLQGVRQFALTGSEEALEASTYTDQGMPYLPRAISGSALASAADLAEDFPRYIVPEAARFVTAAVDVQGGQHARFEVQVHAHGPQHEQWVIDRFALTESGREGPDGKPAPIDPARYPEDWDAITERVVTATYRTTTDGQELRVLRTWVDSGGEDGVTASAKAWWRTVRDQGMGQKVLLYNGASSLTAPQMKLTKFAKPDHDVPLATCNPNLLKSAVSNSLLRLQPGASRLHVPQWLGAWWWDEITAEIRGVGGRWKQVRKRNEALDLAAMNRAAAIALGVDRINWNKPPAWARELLQNSERMTREERKEAKAKPEGAPMFTKSNLWGKKG